MPPPAAPAPDYSAAWAAYYQQQAAAAVGAQASSHPAAPAPYQPAAPAMGAYPYGAQQQPYGAVPGYPGASQPAYPGMQPMGMQPRPPVYPAQPQPYTPSVGPQAYPSARPMQQPMGGYSPYTPGGGSTGPGSNGGAGGGYGPAGGPRPQVGPQAMPMRPPQGTGMGLQQPMGMHPSPNQSFPPAKRPRFDSGPPGPGGGAGPASFTRTGGTIPIPSSAGLPSNPMTIATPMAGPSSSAGGSEYFAGGDGRDGFSMSSRGGRGGGSSSSSMRGGKPMRGGYGYEDDYGPPGGGFRGKPRGMMRASPPPPGPTGPRNSNLTTPRGDRGGFKTRGGRGAFAGNQHRDLPDAPRGPASTRNNRQAKEPTTPASQDKQTRSKDVKEDKKTLTDFKIVGLEVPELEWKWGVVPEMAREDETEASGGRKRKAEGGNDEDGPSSPSASTSGPSQKQQRASYFMTHGKETTSKAEQVTRDVNRLRIYFDSPAGQGHGEKRGRGGIEGLRAPPPAPPTGPKAMLAKQEQESAALAAKEESQPAAESAKEPSAETKQEPVETVAPDAALVKEEPSTTVDAAPIKTEEMPDVVPAKEEAPAPAADPVAIPTASTAEDDVEGLLATLSQDVIDGTSAAAPDVQADDAAGDVSMLSARGSSEPETDPAQPEEPSTTTTKPPADADLTTADPSIEAQTASRPASPVKEVRELSLAPTASEAGPAESVRATPAPDAGDVDIFYRGPEPSDDRISILYERSTRRLCIDADVVERVRISRTEGKVELTIRWNKGAPGAAADVVANGSKPAEPVNAPIAEVAPAVEGAQPDEAAAPAAETTESALVDPSLVAAPVGDPAPADGSTDAAVKDEADSAVTESSGTVVASSATATPPVVSAGAPTNKADPRTWDICRGVLMEQLDEETETFKPVDFETLDDMWDGVEDPCAGWTPPIHKLITADSDPAAPYPTLKCDTFKIVAYLDQDRPLSEPKWVRTGQVEDWLNELFGRMKVGNKKASNWRGKFEILDPEPAPQTPTIQNALDSWATNSTSGSAKERRRFVKTHLCEMDNIFEILLRLSRGLSGGSGPVTPANLAGPLATAASPNSHYAGKQTHVSLAVLAMLRLTYELAEKAGVPATEVNERVSDIIRSIPSSVLFKSVDSIFRDHLAEKKH